MIEPLVENAIKHGIEPKPEGGTVWIRSYPYQAGNMIEVEDNGVGFDTEDLEQMENIGFTYIRTRVLETPGASMEIHSAPGQGSSVHIYFIDKK
jgi:sensor histidine kinase YesM